jgi:hypothetical protein
MNHDLKKKVKSTSVHFPSECAATAKNCEPPTGTPGHQQSVDTGPPACKTLVPCCTSSTTLNGARFWGDDPVSNTTITNRKRAGKYLKNLQTDFEGEKHVTRTHKR